MMCKKITKIQSIFFQSRSMDTMSLKKWLILILGKKIFHLCLLMKKNDGIFTKKNITDNRSMETTKKDHDLKKN